MNKAARYNRIHDQLAELLRKSEDPGARMATLCALLHHKMPGFFWTGVYMIREGKLVVANYQGPLACMELKSGTGVCWAAITEGHTIVVPNVHEFPGHIACDSRSNSEIVIPLRNHEGTIIGVLDIDSVQYSHFDETDVLWLERMVALVLQG